MGIKLKSILEVQNQDQTIILTLLLLIKREKLFQKFMDLIWDLLILMDKDIGM